MKLEDKIKAIRKVNGEEHRGSEIRRGIAC